MEVFIKPVEQVGRNFIRTIILIGLVYFLSNCKGHEKTKYETDLETLIHAKTKNYKKFELKKISEFSRRGILIFEIQDKFCQKIADSLGVTKSYYKADFDNNGLTDYVAIGDNRTCGDENNSCDFSSMVLMNFPNDSVKTYHLTKGQSGCIVPKTVKKNHLTLLEIYGLKGGIWSEEDNKIEKHTLIYKFDGFIDYNENSITQNVEKIEYSTSGCNGTCPVFELTINKDRSSVFNAKHFNFGTDDEKRKQRSSLKEEGVFRAQIKEKDYKEIIDLLDYMNFESLQNEYSVHSTDDQSSILKVTYDNGKVKSINDYGLIGTYSLEKLYELLFGLRNNQNWK